MYNTFEILNSLKKKDFNLNNVIILIYAKSAKGYAKYLKKNANGHELHVLWKIFKIKIKM